MSQLDRSRSTYAEAPTDADGGWDMMVVAGPPDVASAVAATARTLDAKGCAMGRRKRASMAMGDSKGRRCRSGAVTSRGAVRARSGPVPLEARYGTVTTRSTSGRPSGLWDRTMAVATASKGATQVTMSSPLRLRTRGLMLVVMMPRRCDSASSKDGVDDGKRTGLRVRYDVEAVSSRRGRGLASV